VSKKEQAIIDTYTLNFIDSNFQITKKVTTGTICQLIKEKFDAFIVGSDQVWRKEYSIGIKTYFFDFIPRKSSIKRISYAASFGIDTWNYSEEETQEMRDLIIRFNAVSVREKTGVEMCKRYLNSDAIQVLDPVLLLQKSDYLDLIKENKNNLSEKIFAYILDVDNEKEGFINSMSAVMSASVKSIFPNKPKVNSNLIDDLIFPSVDEWLLSFKDSEYVITDSFHGVVFSIIFNKEFFVLKNTKRGLTRIESLLEMFEIKNRIINSDVAVCDVLHIPKIDYAAVNNILDSERDKSMKFLTECLSFE
jgi:hypothetical protein